jgi:hypothetical protein
LEGITMPFKSKAQRRFFYDQARKGLIPWDTVEEWERETKGKSLPERARKKKEGKTHGKKKKKGKGKGRKKASSRKR